jgi:hypothetical protein
MSDNMEFEKTSTGATPLFDGGVKTNVKVYTSHPRDGRVQADPKNGPAGGYTPPRTLDERMGKDRPNGLLPTK